MQNRCLKRRLQQGSNAISRCMLEMSREEKQWGKCCSLCFSMELKQRHYSHVSCCVAPVHRYLDRPPPTSCRPKVRSGRRVPQNQIDFFLSIVVESGGFSVSLFVVVLLNVFVFTLVVFCLSFWRSVSSLAVAPVRGCDSAALLLFSSRWLTM